MANLQLTFACQDYDHTRALTDGTVAPEGVDLKCVHISPPSQIFLRMLNDEEFDISEMSLSNYLIALGHDDKRFIALPVFPSRVFRHSYIWINTNSGIKKPPDLKGKCVGIADYSMTALLFVRGLLQHDTASPPRTSTGSAAARSMSRFNIRPVFASTALLPTKHWTTCSKPENSTLSR